MAGVSKKARGKHRLDKYYHLAKEQGYRSRAAFKLIQLNKKHGFLNDARAVLDLCAAPGGWLQVCAKHMPLSSRIIGVDLDTIKPIRGVTTLVDDITTQKCRDRLRKESAGSLFDVVLHDGAPNVGGAFASESYTQSALVLDACKLACEFLRPKGTFVTKVFRSRDYTALLFAFRQLFARVDATKPQASRNTSAEIFVVCMGYKAPGKIDPRLLDHRVLFADLQEVPKVMGPDALLKTVAKKQRHRVGYDEDVSVMHNPISAVAFVLAKDPVPMLAQYTVIHIDGPESIVSLKKDADADDDDDDSNDALEPAEMAELIRTSEATNDEVRGLCKDLQVLGRSEFKTLLKWRLKVKKAIDGKIKELRKAASQEAEQAEDDAEMVAEEEGGKLSAEERLLKEMEELRNKIERGAKKHRKKRRELKKKAKLRLAAMALTSGIGEQLDPEEEKLFSLDTIKGTRALTAAGEVDALDEDEMENTLGALDSDEEMVSSGEEGSDADSDDDRLRYEEMVEDYIDGAYQAYLDRKSLRAAREIEQRKRKRLGDEGEEGGDGDGLADLPDARGGSESESDEEAGGGLLMDLEDRAAAASRKSGKAVAEQWFAQDAFQDDELLDDDEPPQGRAVAANKKRSRAVAFAHTADDDGEDGDVEDCGDDDDDEEEEEEEEEDDEAADRVEDVKPDNKGKRRDKAPASSQQGGRAAKSGQASRPASGAGAASDSDDDELEAIQTMKEPAARKAVAAKKRAAEGADLAVVPQGKPRDEGGESDSTDTEDEFEAMDDTAKAEIRAMARKWMKSRKNQLSILDAAYNRYTFNDEGLPRWFKDDEAKHMRPMTPATREEIEAERELLRAINARPMKKIAEAKARKKRKVAAKMVEARGKAEAIVDNEDMSIGRKAKEIDKLYARAKAHGKDKKGAAKSSKQSRSQRMKSSKKGPPLDRRMIADKMKGRARQITKAKNKANGGGARRGKK